MEFLKKVIDIIMTKKIFGTFMVILVTYLSIKISNRFINRILTNGKTTYEAKRINTIVKLLKNILNAFLIVIAGLIILGFYGVDTRSLVASLGIVGVVLGLAMQDTMKDFIGGVSLILENYLAVGDLVTYNDFTGEVIELGLRVTKIKSFSGEVLIVANRNIDSLINLSQKKANILIDIDVAYEEKTSKVEKILNKVIEEAIEEKLILPDSTYLGINELSASSVKYLINIHCDQNNRYGIRRDILKRVKESFEKNNIKIPYPQLEVHSGKEI